MPREVNFAAMPGQPLMVSPRPRDQQLQRLYDALLEQGSSTAPVYSIGEGLARVGAALAGGYFSHLAAGRLEEQQQRAMDTWARALAAGNATPAIERTNRAFPEGGAAAPRPSTVAPTAETTATPGRTIVFGDSYGDGLAAAIPGAIDAATPGAGFAAGNLPAMPELRRGDRVVISVGANDYGMDPAAFGGRLAETVEAVRAAGATPVLVAPNAGARVGNPAGLEAIRRQIMATGQRAGIHVAELPAPDVGGLHYSRYGDLVSLLAPRTANTAPNPAAIAISDALWARVLQNESGGRQFTPSGQTVTSPAGATGIAQVMPGTGPEAAALAGLPWDENRFRTDSAYNEALGRAYMDEQLRQFGGNPRLALAAYNGGPGRLQAALSQGGTVDEALARMPAETRTYVARIMGGLAGAAPTVPGQAPVAASPASPGPAAPPRDDRIERMARILMTNPDTAPMGMQLLLQRALAGESSPEEYTLTPGAARFRGGQMIAQAPREPERTTYQNVTGVGLVAIPPGGAPQVAISVPREPEPTSAMRNAIAMGLQPGTAAFNDYIREASRAGTTINMQERSIEREVGQTIGQEWRLAIEGGRSARSIVSTLNRMEQYLNHIDTGRSAPTTVTIQAFARELGLPVGDETVPAGEALQSLANELALQFRDPSGGAGMPGALSERDLLFLQQMAGTISNDPQSLRLMIDYRRRLARRRVEVANLALQHAQRNNGTVTMDFLREVQEFAEQNPLFTEALPLGNSPGTAASPAGTPDMRYDPETDRLVPVR